MVCSICCKKIVCRCILKTLTPYTSKGLLGWIVITILLSSYYRYVIFSITDRASHTCAGLAEAHPHPEPASAQCSAAQLWHATDNVQSTSQRMPLHSTAYVMAQAGNVEVTHTLVADLLTTRAELAPEASISICS